jgi:NTE family protein
VPSHCAPPDPAPPTDAPSITLTLVGGWVPGDPRRIGVIWLLADADLLARLRYSPSVSAGSIATGVLARRWSELRAASYSSAAIDELVIEPIVDAVTRSPMKHELVRNLWRAVGSRTRTDILAWVLERRFVTWSVGVTDRLAGR